MIVEAHEGYGEIADDPRQVWPALKRARKVVKEKNQQAGLQVTCGSHCAAAGRLMIAFHE